MATPPEPVSPPTAGAERLPPGSAPAGPRSLGLIAAGCALALALTLAVRIESRPSLVWDDAYMYVRYAGNLLADGRIAWNPHGPPTYGATSLLYLLVVAGTSLVFRQSPVASAEAASLLCGLAFLILLWRLVRDDSSGTPASRRAVAVLLLVSLTTFSLRDLVVHCASGMDTTFAMAYLTGYLLLARRMEHAPSTRAALLTGLLGGLAFWARPDLALFTLLVPLGVATLSRKRAGGRKAVLSLATTLGVLSACLLANRLYFGTALPLSFYAKVTHLYPDFQREAYRGVSWLMLEAFVLHHGILVLAIGFGALILRGRALRSSPLEPALVLGAVLFCGYYAFLVLQIMPGSARFYYPTLPALALLASRSLLGVWDRAGLPLLPWWHRSPAWARSAGVGLVTALPLFASLHLLLYYHARGRPPEQRGPLDTSREMTRVYRSVGQGVWFGLDRVSALPDDLVLATTEVGLPGVMNPRKVVEDMTGLNETGFALHPFDCEVLLRQYHPDLIYMPHPHYRGMVRSFWSSPRFAVDYEYYSPESLGSPHLLGVALRRSSRYYAAMRAIVARARPSTPPPSPFDHPGGPRDPTVSPSASPDPSASTGIESGART